MKVSVVLPTDLMAFVDEKVSSGAYPTRSAVLIHAIDVMRQVEAENAYRAAFADIDPVWDLAVADGLADEQW